MLLRDHPLMMYKGNHSWPPAWLWTAGYDNTHPRGEAGILKAVLCSHIEPRDRCFVIMEHCGAGPMNRKDGEFGAGVSQDRTTQSAIKINLPKFVT